MIIKINFNLKIIIPIIIITFSFLFLNIKLLNIKLSEYNYLVHLEDKVVTTKEISKLIHEIQEERRLSVIFINTKSNKDNDNIIAQRLATNDAIIKLINHMKRNNIPNQKIVNIHTINIERKLVDSLTYNQTEIMKYYSSVNSKLLYLIKDISEDTIHKKISNNILEYANFLYIEENSLLQKNITLDVLSKSQKQYSNISKFNTLITKRKIYSVKNELYLFIFINMSTIIVSLFMSYLLFVFIKNEQNLRSLINQNVISSTADLKGNIIDVSEAFCKISGYQRDELIGKPHSMLRHKDMNKELFKNIWGMIQKGDTWRGEIKNKKKDGSFYWVIATISPIYLRGKITSYSSTRQDITDKKELEKLNIHLEDRVSSEVKKNREKDKQLTQHARLAQMGEMISMIAHQWRQPLASISSLSLGLNLKAKLGTLNKELTLDLTDKITENSKHLSNTIDDFREFFRPSKEKRDSSFNEIVKSVLNIVESSILTNNINIIQDFNCDKKFSSYPNEIKQVILNLLKNADDILLENKIEKPYIKISTYSTKSNLILEISDNAGGIPKDIINKIFDPYFSTKTKKDGTGLGLYMSKTIIEEHCNGTLSVENSKEGAVFTINIPI